MESSQEYEEKKLRPKWMRQSIGKSKLINWKSSFIFLEAEVLAMKENQKEEAEKLEAQLKLSEKSKADAEHWKKTVDMLLLNQKFAESFSLHESFNPPSSGPKDNDSSIFRSEHIKNINLVDSESASSTDEAKQVEGSGNTNYGAEDYNLCAVTYEEGSQYFKKFINI